MTEARPDALRIMTEDSEVFVFRANFRLTHSLQCNDSLIYQSAARFVLSVSDERFADPEAARLQRSATRAHDHPCHNILTKAGLMACVS